MIITSPSKTAVEIGRPAKYFGAFLIADLTLLAATELQTQASETKFLDPLSGGCPVNLDPGYLDLLKVILASTENANQRIYLKSGIYAEATRWQLAQSLS
jgi:hypothetical protein